MGNPYHDPKSGEFTSKTGGGGPHITHTGDDVTDEVIKRPGRVQRVLDKVYSANMRVLAGVQGAMAGGLTYNILTGHKPKPRPQPPIKIPKFLPKRK